MHASSSHGTVDMLGSARLAYLAEDLCRHLSSMCRMHNDYGSLQRDADEHNLNSTNFPEFHLETFSYHRAGVEIWDKSAKGDLLWIADYERHGVQTALTLLATELGSLQKHVIDPLKLFINVTDLYGQIYVLRDIGTRTK